MATLQETRSSALLGHAAFLYYMILPRGGVHPVSSTTHGLKADMEVGKQLTERHGG